jgi:hypothetical protein
LQEGDTLVTTDSSNVIVEKIIERTDLTDTDVYNIDVEPYDTYVAESVVVHNAKEKDPNLI